MGELVFRSSTELNVYRLRKISTGVLNQKRPRLANVMTSEAIKFVTLYDFLCCYSLSVMSKRSSFLFDCLFSSVESKRLHCSLCELFF